MSRQQKPALVASDGLLDRLELCNLEVGGEFPLPRSMRFGLAELAAQTGCALRPVLPKTVQQGVDTCFALQQLILHGAWFRPATGGGAGAEHGRAYLIENFEEVEEVGRAYEPANT